MKKFNACMRDMWKANWGYILLFLLVSYPVMNDFLIRGHDIYFHIMRIEGMAEGLRGGQFPVRIQPVWFGGFGYACPVFYGDLFLYIPALLRLLGMPLQSAYKAYVLLCNLGTVVIAGYSFGGIFKNRHMGMLGSALYSLSIYRLMNVYVRASMGEYTGMMLLPLLLYAVVLLLDREQDKQSLKKGGLLLGLSMAGIIQSHILTCEIVVFVLGFICLLYIKRIFTLPVIKAGVKAVLIAAGLSVWFLVPFCDYMLTGKYNVNAFNGGHRLEAQIQQYGVFVSQLGNLFHIASGENLSREAGTRGEMSLGIGIGLTAALFGFLVLSAWLKEEKKQREWKIARAACLASVLSLWMMTVHFPWDFLRRSNVLMRYLIVNIQFPWRMGIIATLALTLLWCCIGVLVYQKFGSRLFGALLGGLLLITGISAVYFMDNLLDVGEVLHIDSYQEMDTYVKSGNEYLPVNTVPEDLKRENLVVEDGLELSGYEIEGTTIRFSCTNTTEIDKIMEIPLLYYRGYEAVLENGQGRQTIEVYSGTNNAARMVIGPQTEGTITVSYQEPLYWRLAELVSALTLAGCVLAPLLKRKKEKPALQAEG